MSIKKRIFAVCLAAVCAFASNVTMPVFAMNNDTVSADHGFSVDLDKYYSPNWQNKAKTYVLYNNKTVGYCQAYIGLTRAKAKNGSKYRDQVMISCDMKGQGVKGGLLTSGNYGYSKQLIFESRLPSGTSLIDHSPRNIATSSSYTIGAQVSPFGLSASTSFEKNALEIFDNSDSSPSKRWFEIRYNYHQNEISPPMIINSSWKFNNYSYGQSRQLAHYVIETSASRYNMWVDVTPTFALWDGEPGLFAAPIRNWKGSIKTVSGFVPVNINKTPY